VCNSKVFWITVSVTSRNNSIHNNSIFTTQMGIEFVRSDNNNAINNTITWKEKIDSYNDYGIDIYDSHNNLVQNNRITGFEPAGIYLSDSDKNVIDNNTMSNNENGLYIRSDPDQNIITNNTMINNTQFGIYIRDQNFLNRYNIISPSNLINGDPFYYLFNVHGTPQSPIVLENLSLQGFNISNYGKINLIKCSYITIKNCKVNNNSFDGIFLYRSDNITITLNDISNNSDEGIDNSGSQGTIISHNEIVNNRVGIELQGTSYNYIFNNSILDHVYGIGLTYGTNNEISNNNISDNEHGVHLSETENDILRNNIILNSQIDGVEYYSKKPGSILNNIIKNSGEYDFHLYWNMNLTVIDTVFETVFWEPVLYPGHSKLIVKNHIRIRVFDTNGITPLQGTDVIITDNGDPVYSTSGYGGSDAKTNGLGYTPAAAGPYGGAGAQPFNRKVSRVGVIDDAIPYTIVQVDGLLPW